MYGTPDYYYYYVLPLAPSYRTQIGGKFVDTEIVFRPRRPILPPTATPPIGNPVYSNPSSRLLFVYPDVPLVAIFRPRAHRLSSLRHSSRVLGRTHLRPSRSSDHRTIITFAAALLNYIYNVRNLFDGRVYVLYLFIRKRYRLRRM